MTDYSKLTKEELIKKLEYVDEQEKIRKKIRMSGISKDSPLQHKIKAIVYSYGRFCIEENRSTKEMQLVSYIKNSVSYQSVKDIETTINNLLGF